MFASRPGVALNLQIQTGDVASFYVRTNQFGFNVTGSYGLIMVMEATTSLRNAIWYLLQTNILAGGSFYFGDPPMDKLSSTFLPTTVAMKSG